MKSGKGVVKCNDNAMILQVAPQYTQDPPDTISNVSPIRGVTHGNTVNHNNLLFLLQQSENFPKPSNHQAQDIRGRQHQQAGND